MKKRCVKCGRKKQFSKFSIDKRHGTLRSWCQKCSNAGRIPEYSVWAEMKQRCYNFNSKSYKWYGARGIKVCKRWRESFKAFIEDMGRRPTVGLTIDRIDNNEDYCPQNCNWIPNAENARKRRNVV